MRIDLDRLQMPRSGYRRTGNTTRALDEVIQNSHLGREQIFFVSPTYRRARHALDAACEYFTAAGCEILEVRRVSSLSIRFRNEDGREATVFFLSKERRDLLVGIDGGFVEDD